MNNTSPVMFGLPGLNENTDTNNSGFDSAPAPSMQAYTIPPVVWMILFLVAGYFGVRYFMED